MPIAITDEAVRAFEDIANKLRRRAQDAVDSGQPSALIQEVEGWLGVNRRRLILKVAEDLAEKSVSLEIPEEWTPARRTQRNLEAMRLIATKSPAVMTVEDRGVLAAYSGWGGLSIEKVKDLFPASLEVDPESLIHEYYTPFGLCAEIARVVQPLLGALAGFDGVIRSLEPSAGIGRMIRGFDALPSRPPMRWTAVELSALAANLLTAVRPGTEVVPLSFETWVAKNSTKPFSLVVANPPFGKRGPHKHEDPDRGYQETTAAAYFVRRGLDMLTTGGLGIFIIPSGFMSDPRKAKWREQVLLRHHLLTAYRLPSHIRSPDGKLRPLFPGTQNVVDVLFFQRRPGELESVDDSDLSLIDGAYFEGVPGHVLGAVDQTAGQFKVIGPPIRLPDLLARPICQSCRMKLAEPAVDVEDVEDVKDDPKLDTARALGQRVGTYLEALARGGDAAAQQWAELHEGLTAWSRSYGSPFAAANLRDLAGDPEFLRAWDVTGRLIPTLQVAPQVELGRLAALQDPVALAGYLWAQERGLTVARLMGVLVDQGQAIKRQDVLQRLYSAGWCVDGPGLLLLLPRGAYLTGDLWRRLDHLDGSPDHPRAAPQRELLRAAIPPVLLGDLGDYSPRMGWVPTSLIESFAVDALSASTMKLTRRQGFISPEGIEYESIEPGDKNPALTADAIAFLGWLNHDLAVFRPKRGKNKSLLEEREERAARWEGDFRDWIAADANRTRSLLDAYVLKFRGYRRPTFSTEPIALARWTDNPKAQLFDYQCAAVRRIAENRGGILSFDVGVGKTFTSLAALALLRQEGVVKRPVILVPNSLVFQWLGDIKRVLPDYRVGLIGSKLVTRHRGKKRGQLDSANDTGLERAGKWARFQGGEYDLVLLTYTAMPRTRIDYAAAEELFDSVSSLAREIRISRRAANRKDPDKLSEREEAIKGVQTAGWVRDRLQLPPNWEYDGEIVWDSLGCDFLIVDEFHNFKNLFMPDARERGLPAFMGSGGEGSDRAWQLFFRAAAVRRLTGGSGVLGLTATPAKNGPTELFSAFSIIDPKIWADYGIGDAEQFIDQFCLLESRPVVTTSMAIEERSAMIGFQNLGDLRVILERYIEFKSAREAAQGGKLKKPKATAKSVPLQQDDEQRRKLAEMMDSLRKHVRIQLGDDSPGGAAAVDNAQLLDEKSSAPDLGMIARLGLIAIHAQLDEGYTLTSAVDGGLGKDNQHLPPPRSFHSPKFDAVAERVVASSNCGHIVFLEPLAAQAWLREVLVQAGIPRERIALLNAQTAKSGTDRLRIATDFNEGKYIVVIANSVAGEGTNLQRRTCAVHNVDIPWDPMTRRQRIGRADRQGNELAAVTVYDYLTLNSGDGPRFHKLMGKGTWIEMVVQSKDDISINPAAQIALSPIELLADLTNDPEESRRLLGEIEKKQALRKNLQVRSKIARLLRAINDRFRAAEREQSAENSALLRGDGERMLTEMDDFDPAVWPFLDLARRVVRDAIVVTEAALPLWSGLRLDNGSAAFEVGRVEAGTAGIRQRGAYHWEQKTGSELTAKAFPLFEPPDYTRPWRVEKAVDLSDRLGQISPEQFLALNWSWASTAWLRDAWTAHEPLLRKQFARRGAQNLPATSREGELYLASGRELEGLVLLSPGDDGWAAFTKLAPATDHSPTDLADAARRWWGRSLPRARRARKDAAATSVDPALAELLTTLDPADAEALLPLHRKRRAVREALAILLPRRGLGVRTSKGIQGEVIVLDGNRRYTLPANKLLSGDAVRRGDPTEEAAGIAVRDVLGMVEVERATHGDGAFDVVLNNLERDPAFYDSAMEAARPAPEPEPEPKTETKSEPRREEAPPTKGDFAAPAPAETDFRLHRIFHTKRNRHMPLVEIVRRVDDDEFSRLRVLAAKHNGYYSKYARTGVPKGFMFEASADAQAFILSANSPSPTSIPPLEPGHAYNVGGVWFGDSNLLRALGAKGYSLEGLGMGDFTATGPNGAVTAKVLGYGEPRSPEQVGRMHSLVHSAGEDELEKLLGEMENSGAIQILPPWEKWPSSTERRGDAILDEIITQIRKDLDTQTRLGGDTQRLIGLTLAYEKDGWPAGMPVGWVFIHKDKDPDGWNFEDFLGAFQKYGRRLADQQNLKLWVIATVREASKTARGAQGLKNPSGSAGSAYFVGDKVYLDGKALNRLRASRKVEEAGKGLVYVLFEGYRLELTQTVEDAGLPGEEGPLYRLTQEDAVAPLISAGIVELRGAYPKWPSERNP